MAWEIKEPPRFNLANLPTPLIRLDRIERRFPGARVLMKRDDLSGLELSGNKIRKLEFILAEARAAGVNLLITEGTPQSNHCRATAAACVRAGIQARLLVRPPLSGEPNGNLLLDRLFEAEVRGFDRALFEKDRSRIVADELARAKTAGRTARFVPMGASEPLGCWGYARCVAELVPQLRAARTEACDLVVAASSGGTVAGLRLGLALHRVTGVRLHGVPVSDDVAFHAAQLERLCGEFLERWPLADRLELPPVEWVDGYVGAGYAIPHDGGNRAIRSLAAAEAIVLDPVYTGKAFAAVLDGLSSGRFGFERPVVFVHTGGLFSNFAWPETLLASAADETLKLAAPRSGASDWGAP